MKTTRTVRLNEWKTNSNRRAAHTSDEREDLWGGAIDRSRVCSASFLPNVAERKSMPQNELISYIKPKQTTVSPKWEISQPFQSRERKWRKAREKKTRAERQWYYDQCCPFTVYGAINCDLGFRKVQRHHWGTQSRSELKLLLWYVLFNPHPWRQERKGLQCGYFTTRN